MAHPPTRLATDQLEVEVLPTLGARLHRLRAFDQEVILTPDDAATHASDPFFWGGYVMAPWCNRIETGRVRVGAREIALESNFRDGTAIHGQVYARPWQDHGDGRFSVRGGGDTWPWPYEVGAWYRVAGTALTIELTLTNLGDDPMPGGIGIHPWFRRPLEVAIHGSTVFPANAATEPQPDPVTPPFDLREIGSMADDLDATWADLTEPAVQIRWPATGVRMTMTTTSPTTYIVAASPSIVDAVAIEPETHAPQGLRRLLGGEPGGLTWTDPGTTLRLTTTFAFEHAPLE